MADNNVTVTKKQIVSDIAKNLEKSRTEVNDVVEMFIECIMEELSSGNSVSIHNFGVFSNRFRAPRDGRNPKNGEKIRIDASISPAFKAGKNFKSMVSHLTEH